MDFSTAFRFFTEDATWKRKFAIAALLLGIPAVIATVPVYLTTADPENLERIMMGSLFSLLSFPLLIISACVTTGYSIDISRNVRDGNKHPLPEWSFGEQFVQGGKLIVASIVYMIPLMLLLIFGVIAAVSAGGFDFTSAPSTMDLAPLTLTGTILFSGLLTFFMGAIQVNYIRRNTFSSCFQFKNIGFIIRKRWKMLLLMVLLTCAVSLFTSGPSLLLSPVGQLIFAAAIAFTLSGFMIFVNGHLYGQIASLIDLDKLNEADGVG